ncbi:virB8 family protein [Pseudomonas syringae]|uniref:virB8 family protein n=1 Tax=Pseudomonas syringae TaxID=317 RepID=UPI000465819C|nr:VirB8/TrbF family protein [Pseudomonas syringae]QGG78955.1 virB8 family protein [Pseudomonas syringae USA011]
MFGKDKNKGLQAPSSAPEPKSETQKMMDMGNDWEASRIEAIEKSERRAWKVAGAFGAGFVVTAIALMLLMPLKESVPYVIRVDNTTGVPDIVTAMDEKGVGYDEAMDKYWLAQYVRAHETYDWYTLQNDYNTVGLLSSQTVGAEYAAMFEGKNALDKTYGSSVKALVHITSVVPTGEGTGTVRFTKTTKRVDDPNSGATVKYVATISYEYRNPSRLLESQRLINPFGFQVRTYRVDPELAGGE